MLLKNRWVYRVVALVAVLIVAFVLVAAGSDLTSDPTLAAPAQSGAASRLAVDPGAGFDLALTTHDFGSFRPE